jgi:SAM-dependent methyltransferase
LSIAEKQGNKWKVEEFFQTGNREIGSVIEHLKSQGLSLKRGKALDFGCGMGRLTQALTTYFDQVYGVDIAPSMSELAEKYNRHRDKCKYLLNAVPNLRVFPANMFTFVYTNLVLQHIEPRYSKHYLKEFLRVLVPGGVLVFQLPSEPTEKLHVPSRPKTLKDIKRLLPEPIIDACHRGEERPQTQMRRQTNEPAQSNDPVMEMWGIRRKELERFLKTSGGIIVEVCESQDAGPGWQSFRYFVKKNDARSVPNFLPMHWQWRNATV